MSLVELLEIHGSKAAIELSGLSKSAFYRQLAKEKEEAPQEFKRGFSFDLEPLAGGIGTFQQKLDAITGYANTTPLILIPYLDGYHPFSPNTTHDELSIALRKLRTDLNWMYQTEGIENNRLVYDRMRNYDFNK
ncbi:hypothetical protein ACTBAC_004694 [Vibrio parahaemolyticus]|nr:hypothetical protein [Vibrio parahaemolyticus]EHD0105983.1 hypothetical protein [Vibrio parahaemolyticus]EHD0108515.1 hypothetical protein [Vibrio parahaemolyticus]EHK9086601.1 hypothetical protein [Vibrio parahaemolyticus]EHK9575612.1 hypothetical protein [Vibrio parahaemolyticus]